MSLIPGDILGVLFFLAAASHGTFEYFCLGVAHVVDYSHTEEFVKMSDIKSYFFLISLVEIHSAPPEPRV